MMETLSTYTQPFFEWLLRSTVQAGIVICLIFLIQAVLRNRLTARWHYALWLILVVRMVLPWAPQSRFSIYNLAPWQTETEAPTHATLEQNAEPATIAAEPSTAPQTTAGPQPADTTERQNTSLPAPIRPSHASPDAAAQMPFRLSGVLPFLWLAGAMLLGTYIVVSNLRLWRAASVECPSTDTQTLDLLEECRTAVGLRTIVALVPSQTINTPVLLGFVRPRLLVPKSMAEKLNREELRCVFLHELAHVKRHDIAIGWLTTLLQVVHWFNPFIWLAFHRMRSNRESACDALVLSRMQGEETQNYGLAIVSLLEHFSAPQPLPGLAGILESKSQLKRRIAMITQFKNNSYRWSPLAVILMVILAGISLPDARDTKASEASAVTPTDQPHFRKIRIPIDRLRPDAPLSPDGKKIAFVFDKKLWVMPRVGNIGPDFPGTPRLLNTGDIKVSWGGETWSGDSRWIAFHDTDQWNEKEKRWGNRAVYVISVDGGEPKEVYEDWSYGDYLVNVRMSLSPNGKILAFSSVDANEQHIYTIDVEGGLPRRITEAPSREPVFSPDGKMIAYVEDKNLDRAGGGLFIVPSDGGVPKRLAEAGNATSPVWSPDGRMIAYLDQTMKNKIFIIPIRENGERRIEKNTFDCPDGIQSVLSLTGWTPDNKLGAIFISNPQDGLYTLPATGGIATLVTNEKLHQPRWSPDGKQIIGTIDVGKGKEGWMYYGLACVSTEGGEISIVPVRAETKIIKLSYSGGNHVSPDGQTIVFAGRKELEPEGISHIWTIPIEGGEPKQLTNANLQQTDWFPCWAPDGKNIAFIRRSKNEHTEGISKEADIYIISANGKELRQLTQKSDKVMPYGYIAWSPDGKWISYFSTDMEIPNSELTLNVIPAEGGTSRVVGKPVGSFDVRIESAWSPDSKQIAIVHKLIKIISLDDGSIEEIDTHLTDTNISYLDWTHNGNRLVFSGRQGGGLEFWTMENFLPQEIGK
ncbi:MAG: PD40 domain-containing protein [Sedimentisphaerales bacterium]|nr:PD40 domain-containing protein [Sedimentisphaerales bacterium]